jgi:hypothetical protein
LAKYSILLALLIGLANASAYGCDEPPGSMLQSISAFKQKLRAQEPMRVRVFYRRYDFSPPNSDNKQGCCGNSGQADEKTSLIIHGCLTFALLPSESHSLERLTYCLPSPWSRDKDVYLADTITDTSRRRSPASSNA